MLSLSYTQTIIPKRGSREKNLWAARPNLWAARENGMWKAKEKNLYAARAGSMGCEAGSVGSKAESVGSQGRSYAHTPFLVSHLFQNLFHYNSSRVYEWVGFLVLIPVVFAPLNNSSEFMITTRECPHLVLLLVKGCNSSIDSLPQRAWAQLNSE
jgi:hypothetical protein